MKAATWTPGPLQAALIMGAMTAPALLLGNPELVPPPFPSASTFGLALTLAGLLGAFAIAWVAASKDPIDERRTLRRQLAVAAVISTVVLGGALVLMWPVTMAHM